MLLFEAIGGNGKSMLTWEWTNNHATKIRPDWAGRFWYSFYERGAIMADFCQHALAYITGQPLKDFQKKKTPELSKLLLHHLQARPWLFVLDGLERVLVAYHRIDAAEVPDEAANAPTDKILSRDPCAAIRPEDDDLLRALASAAPSKILVSSRLVPRVLLNAASQSIPGVTRISLPGLRPPDAEALLRSCGITGDSQAIQQYLTSNCDCHPLVIGVLAGLINDYLPDKGNFDAWARDPNGGGQLNLAELDLIQKRNHILQAGLDALPEKSRQLLSTLALVSEAVDYPTLCALNPHLPPEPEEVSKPTDPENSSPWKWTSEEKKPVKKQEYQVELQQWKDYELAVQARLKSPEFLAAPQRLAETVRGLEHRGLLQYDGRTKRFDLHPVVRGVASGGLQVEEKNQFGNKVVDHFSKRVHDPYEQAETLDDVRDGLHVVRTLLKMGRYEEACDAYRGDLSTALLGNLESYAETLSLLRPFFPTGWDALPAALDTDEGSYLANDAAAALSLNGDSATALAAYNVALIASLEKKNWGAVQVRLRNIACTFRDDYSPRKTERITLLLLDLAALLDDRESLFMSRIFRFAELSDLGHWENAEAMWKLLDPMGRNWKRATYRPGDAECIYAFHRFRHGDLREEQLLAAERLARGGRNRGTVRDLHSLRGRWRMAKVDWKLAAESLEEAVRMARSVGQTDARAETLLALAKFHLGQLADPHGEAKQLAEADFISNRALAELWLAIGDLEQAKKHALAAYESAWADGEPYVYRYELDKATALLKQLGAEIPKLPKYDPAKDEKFPWEDKLIAAIEKLRKEKEAKQKKTDD